MIASVIVALLAVELGWWWFQWYQHLQYRKDHPNTIFLVPYRPRLTRWGRAIRLLLRLAWTLVVVATFGGCVAVDVVLIRGVGNVVRCAKACIVPIGNTIRARLVSRTESDDLTSTTSRASTSTFVLAPILRSKPKSAPTASSDGGGPPTRTSWHRLWSSADSSNNRPKKKGVTFEQHSNGQIRHQQISFDPASATAFYVDESRTPSPGQSPASAQQQSKARMAQTPPLPRRGRASLGVDKEHERAASAMLLGRTDEVERRSSDTAPGTPQNGQTPESTATKVSRPVIPPYPGASALLEESLRKRRASSSSSNGYSPAVKRMYGRLRLPPQATSQVPYQYAPHVVARKMKRQRENDLILWKSFNTVPSANKKTAVQPASAAVPDLSSEVQSTSQSSFSGPPQQPAANVEVAKSLASDQASNPNPPTALFHFGSSAPTSTPLASTEGASNGGAAAPETASVGGSAAAAAPGITFGFPNASSVHPTESAAQGSVIESATSSGGASSDPGAAAATILNSQLGSSNVTTEAAGAAADTASTATFQGAFTNGGLTSTNGNSSLGASGETSAPQRFEFGASQNASFRQDGALTATPTVAANSIPTSDASAAPGVNFTTPTSTIAESTSNSAPTAFQFGSGLPQQNGTAAYSLPSTGFAPKTPDPAAQAVSTSASSTVFAFGAGPEQPMGNGGASAPPSTFQFGSNSFGAPGSGVGMTSAPSGGFSLQPASSGAASNPPFQFGQTPAQPTGMAQPFVAPTASWGASSVPSSRPRGTRKPSRPRPPRR